MATGDVRNWLTDAAMQGYGSQLGGTKYNKNCHAYILAGRQLLLLYDTDLFNKKYARDTENERMFCA